MADVGRELADRELRKLERKLAREYAQAEKELRKKREEFTKEYQKELKKKKALLEKGKLTKERYKQWLEQQALYESWVSEMADYMANEQVNANRRAAEIMNNATPKVYAEAFNFGTFLVEDAVGIDTMFTLYNADTVARLMKDNPKLLPEANIDIPKDKRWNYQKMKTSLVQSVLQGESVPKMAKRLRRVTDMNKTSAIRNARTMFVGAENSGRLDSFQRAIDLGIKMKKMWSATMDSRTRNSHAVLDGETIDLEEKFSNGLMYPGDPDGSPSEVYNCRCRLSAQLAGFGRNNRHIVDGENVTEEEYLKWKYPRQAKNVLIPTGQSTSTSSYERIFSTATVYKCKTHDDFIAYAKNEFGADVDIGVKALDLDLVKDGVAGVEAVVKDVLRVNPDALSYIQIKFQEEAGGFMSVVPKSDTLINYTFNGKVFKNKLDYLNSIQKGLDDGSFFEGTSPATLGAHEAGHIVEWILDQYVVNNSKYFNVNSREAWNKNLIADEIVSEARKSVSDELTRRRKAGASWDDLIELEEEFNRISGYAKRDSSEKMAEAFHDVYAIRKENASYFNKEVVKISLERVRKRK